MSALMRCPELENPVLPRRLDQVEWLGLGPV